MNYVFPVQLNIVFKKKELTKDVTEIFNCFVKDISEKLYSETYNQLVYQESDKYTINLLGEFHPHKDDSRKHHNSIMKYSTTKKWILGESTLLFNEILKKYKDKLIKEGLSEFGDYVFRIGFMQFQ
jgi:hypothetical protein